MNKTEIHEELTGIYDLMSASISHFENKSYRFTYNNLQNIIERLNELSSELLEIV